MRGNTQGSACCPNDCRPAATIVLCELVFPITHDGAHSTALRYLRVIAEETADLEPASPSPWKPTCTVAGTGPTGEHLQGRPR